MRPCRPGDIALCTHGHEFVDLRASFGTARSIDSVTGWKEFDTRQEVQDMIAVARAIA